MTDLEDGQAAAAVARDVAFRLLAASEEAVAGGADVPAQYVGIFPTAYGWWRFICRSAEAALLLGEHGFTVEAAPVLRNVVNHAYTLHWLVDNGPLAVDALIAKDREGAEKMCKNLEQADWPVAAEYRRLLEERKAQPTPARSAADEELLRKLKHELGNVYDMLNRYASAEVYLVYSHLSGMSHTSIEYGQRLPGVDRRRDLPDPRPSCGPWARGHNPVGSRATASRVRDERLLAGNPTADKRRRGCRRPRSAGNPAVPRSGPLGSAPRIGVRRVCTQVAMRTEDKAAWPFPAMRHGPRLRRAGL